MTKEKPLIITLNNNKKYVLVSSILFEGKKYVYLSGLEDYKDVIIGEIENDEITVVSDINLFGKLIIEFNKKISRYK